MPTWIYGRRFNSAAAASPRKRGQTARIGRCQRGASIRPRLASPRKQGPPLPLRLLHLASIRPRLQARGNGHHRSIPVVAPEASIRPRLQARGNLLPNRFGEDDVKSLQFGRGCKPAETKRTVAATGARSAPLQFGRGCKPAETSQPATDNEHLSRVLQFGRGCKPAETPPPRRPAARPWPGFNSAAAASPRKRADTDHDKAVADTASIRPRLQARGNGRVGLSIEVADPDASIRPRLQARGNFVTFVFVRLPWCAGFNSAAAASPRKPGVTAVVDVLASSDRFNSAAAASPRKRRHAVSTRAAHCTGFNSAAAASPRKLTQATAVAESLHVASIRPRLQARGNVCRRAECRVSRGASIRPRRKPAETKTCGTSGSGCLTASIRPRLQARGNRD